MYKVLLADDENLDLEGMKTFIPWQELGMEVVDAVTNGFAACKVLETETVDILVTDVRMPNMSGLELAKRAIEKQGALRVIFVSGYQDFHYVKQALALNACSYVLKPMDDQELIDSLVKVRGQLDQERARQEADLAYKQMIPIAKNEYLLRLLEGSTEADVLQALGTGYGMNGWSWPGRAAVLEIDDLAWKLGPQEGREAGSEPQAFISEVMELSRRLGIEHVCKVSRQRIMLLLPADGAELAEEVLRHLNERSAFTVTAGLGGEAGGLAALADSYREAAEALEYKMFYGKGRIIFSGQLRTAQREDSRKLDLQLDALFEAMANYDLVRIHDELQRLFQVAMSLKSRFTIHNFALALLMKLDERLRTMNEDLFSLLGMELQDLDILHRFETISDIHSWLRRRVFEVSERLHTRRRNKNWKLVSEVQAYLQTHLAENITLKDVAERFSFSPNYLGSLFKEETGRGFSEYLITLRMEKACELLRQSKLKIYEIAEGVGYRYLPYFSRQFKETYGMTPLEYRRKH
ncbi:response regulator transcription factor [Paenibacillus caseinilyticus]|uniref:AraC family transcriptional regulator n=1 Tax=Paenibacillus mucilaginosus K02 TaxID=997761 RepID=R9UPE9_9BACL|nr:response regulator [Paenibacillus mucilaginosus]AGN70500.1 AraC family transcriptional regulator [Paenibacillus mucilaginosus K02]